MRKSLLLLTVFVAVLFQLTAVNHFKFFGIKPDLILISIVVVSLSSDLKFALPLSIAAGAFKDIYGSGAFAVNALLSALWSFLVINLARRVSVDMNLTRAGLVFIIAFLNALAMAIFLWYQGIGLAFGIFMRLSFLDSLYTALVSLLIFKILKIR